MSDDQEHLTRESVTPSSEDVDKEIQEGLKGERGTFGLLNNFETRLPGGFFETRYNPDDPFSDESQTGKTIKEFLVDRDTAIVTSDIDLNELGHLRDIYKTSQGVNRGVAMNVYLTYALPVYKELRLMGYSQNDLTF